MSQTTQAQTQGSGSKGNKTRTEKIKESVARATRHRLAAIKEGAESKGEAITKKYEAVKGRIKGEKSELDYGRRHERLSNMIKVCREDKLLADAVDEADRTLKSQPPVRSAKTATEGGEQPPPSGGQQGGGKPQPKGTGGTPTATTDWSDAYEKLGIATAKLTEARKNAERQAKQARRDNPLIGATISRCEVVLAQRRLPEDERQKFEVQLRQFSFDLAKGNTSGLQAKVQGAESSLAEASTRALNKLNDLMARHSLLSRQLAGSELSPDKRLEVANHLDGAENHARAYVYDAATKELDAAAKLLGKPNGTLPDAASIQKQVDELEKKVSKLYNECSAGTSYELNIGKATLQLINQLDGCRYMLTNGKDAVAVDVKRIVSACDKEYARLRGAMDNQFNIAKDFPPLQKSFAEKCDKVAAHATELYRKTNSKGDTKGAFHASIDELKARLESAAQAALTIDDLHMTELENELQAIDGAITVAETQPPISKDRLAYDNAVAAFGDKIRALDAKAEEIMSADSDRAMKLGLLTAPVSLRREGEQASAVDPGQSQLAEFTKRLTDVVKQIDAKLQEIAKTPAKPVNDPQKLREKCNQFRQECEAGIKEVLDAVTEDDKRLISKLKSDERAALKEYGAALTKELAAIAAPAASPSADVALLTDAVNALGRFRDRVQKFKAMAPGEKRAKGQNDFSDVDKAIKEIEDALSDELFEPRRYNDDLAGWNKRLEQLKRAPHAGDPADVCKELEETKAAIKKAKLAAEQEHKQAEDMILEIRDVWDNVVLAEGNLSDLIKQAPAAFADFKRELETAQEDVKRADKPNAELLKKIKEKYTKLTDASKTGTDSRSAAEKEANEKEAAYQAAKFKLEELLEVDIPLLAERFKDVKRETRKKVDEQLSTMRKAAEAALTTLKQNRDGKQAEVTRDSIAQRMRVIEDSPLGNSTRDKNELGKVNERWKKTIESLHARLEALPNTVKRVCGEVPTAKTHPDPAALSKAQEEYKQILAAVDKLKATLVVPLQNELRADAFDATIKRIGVADENNALDAREDALREIRRLRRWMVSDPLVRMVVQSPFEPARVPFRGLEMALWDVETNLLTSDT